MPPAPIGATTSYGPSRDPDSKDMPLLCWGIDHRAVPMFDQLAVADTERVEGEDLVEGPGRGGRILAIVSMDDRHEIAFGHHDLEGIPRRRLRTRRRAATSA